MKFDYNQKDFVEQNYKKLLAKINNKTIFYNEIEDQSSFALWRHDVDLSVHRAYSLAKIEKNLNIKATYFLLLGSNFYNLFENDIKKLVSKIVSLGHQLGLHFDPETYDIKNIKELEKYLTFERNILENLFQTKIKVFSFHNPSKEILLRYNHFKYAKMINTYGKYFKKEVKYCSDSNGYWRHKRLENFLDENYSKIQVLTHPGWWQKRSMPSFSRIKRCINGRALNVKNDYIIQMKKLKRKIIY